jgi:hypothetical protein
MDGTLAIERNREALRRVVAGLVAMFEFAGAGRSLLAPAGGGAPGPHPELRADPELVEGEPRRTLPRHLHRAILRLLRPAESAARRLIIALASSLPPLPGLRPRKPGPPKARRPKPRKPKPASLFVRDGARTGPRTGIVLPPGAPIPASLAHLVPARGAPRRLSLPLMDTLPRWRIRRRWRPPAGVPRISIPGVTPRAAVPVWRPPLPNDPLDAGRLGRRLSALVRALNDLPGEARRFLRWRARRDRAFAAGRAHRVTPLRGGRPPGGRLSRYDPDARRRANIRDVDEILAHAHALADYALANWTQPPDTS